jgi:hypothetical protein
MDHLPLRNCHSQRKPCLHARTSWLDGATSAEAGRRAADSTTLAIPAI